MADEDDGSVGDIRWNFEKFPIKRDGKVSRFNPTVVPDDPKVTGATEAA